MSKRQTSPLRLVHRALADPLRIRLFELLAGMPRSAKELAELVEMPADRLYHHLAQLEEGGLIEVAEYRKLRGGKVERVYAPTASEPPSEEASPAELAQFLGSMLEATRADINAAAMAKEAGERREIGLFRTTVRLNDRHLTELKGRLEELLLSANDHPDDDGVFTTVVWSVIDRQDRATCRVEIPSSPSGTDPKVARDGVAQRLSCDADPPI